MINLYLWRSDMLNEFYNAIKSYVALGHLRQDWLNTGPLFSAEGGDAAGSRNRTSQIRSPGDNHPLYGPPGGRLNLCGSSIAYSS
jgi:hypothetical protein